MHKRSRRILQALATLAVFTMCQLGYTQTSSFGNYAAGGPSSGLSGDYKRGSKFQVNQDGVLTSLHALLDGYGGPQTGYQNITLAVYRDSNGVPGVKLIESDPIRIYALTSPDNSLRFAVRPTPLTAGFYWLVIHSGGPADGSTPGIARDFGGGPATNWYGNADNFSDGASSPFGAGSSGTGTLTISGSFLTGSQLIMAGRPSIAATASNGLTSHFKRGPRVSFAKSGRLTGLSVYLDGKGATTGTQKLRYVLYRDSGGVPTTKVVESSEVIVKAGQAGAWVTADTPQVVVDAGNYWLMVQSGDTGGIARDFGDGAANWYGNADLYSDGASNTFGAGSAGTGTISAVAYYVPDTAPTRAFGQTTVGTLVSNGLTADYSRGSNFGAYTLSNNAIVMALWAYLDGNGGASGSQQVRMAVYLTGGYRDEAYGLLYQTEPVTIQAGMSPRWVRFPLKAPEFMNSNPGYQLMILSGPTGGVVRDYGISANNWLGLPDTFLDGARNRIDWYHDSQVTRGNMELSTYIEYAEPALPGP
jgi:hypothetical protein